MADNIITPQFRAGFISVFRTSSGKNLDGTMGKPKYSVRACFPPTADMTAMKAQATVAAQEKWGDKTPKTIRSPFRLNEELDNPVPGIGDDWIIATFSANEDRRPGLVDANLQDIIDESDVYSGAWFRAQVRAFAYDNAGNRGVSFGLQNLQKMKDDEPIGSGKMPAAKAFEAAGSGSEGKSAASIFG